MLDEQVLLTRAGAWLGLQPQELLPGEKLEREDLSGSGRCPDSGQWGLCPVQAGVPWGPHHKGSIITEAIEAQRGFVICLRSHSTCAPEARLDPGLHDPDLVRGCSQASLHGCLTAWV